MSGRTRIALAAGVAALSLAVAVAPASAGKNGPNNVNAKKCQKGGWETFYTGAGNPFASEQECVSYGAQGGSLRGPFDYAGRDACAAAEGTFALGTDPQLWGCQPTDSFTTTESFLLREACFTDVGTEGFVLGGDSEVLCFVLS